MRRWLQRLYDRLRPREEPEHLRVGRWGEREAAAYLQQHHCRIIGRRLRVGRKDEIDLLARDGETLVFVEVKTRADESFGRPASAVNNRKRHRLSRAAVRYVSKLRKKPDYIRFDVVEVVGHPDRDEPPAIHRIENAFTLSAPYRLQW